MIPCRWSAIKGLRPAAAFTVRARAFGRRSANSRRSRGAPAATGPRFTVSAAATSPRPSSAACRSPRRAGRSSGHAGSQGPEKRAGTAGSGARAVASRCPEAALQGSAAMPSNVSSAAGTAVPARHVAPGACHRPRSKGSTMSSLACRSGSRCCRCQSRCACCGLCWFHTHPGLLLCARSRERAVALRCVTRGSACRRWVAA